MSTFDPVDVPQRGGSALPAPRTGQLVAGRWEIREPLGHGPLGAVWRARDRGTEQWVAWKLIRPHLVQEARDRERFDSALAALRCVEHSAVVRLLDAGEHEGAPFLVTELLSGRSLRDVLEVHRLQGDAMPIEEVRSVAEQMLQGLAAIHGKTLHRDLKPENVLLVHEPSQDGGVRGGVKLADAAIANVANPTLLASSWVDKDELGLGYEAPEGAGFAEEIDVPADLWAAGAILYEMLTGRKPGEAWEAPSRLRADAPPGLDRVLEVALRPSSHERFVRAEDMLEALRDAFLAGTPRHGRGGRVAFVALAALSSLLLAAALGYQLSRPGEDERIASEMSRRELLRAQVKASLPMDPGATLLDPRDADMVFVPPGDFVRGRWQDFDEGLPGELPEQVVHSAGFWIERHERHVPAQALRRAAAPGAAAAAARWNEQMALQPDADRSWEEADALCRIGGRRLCTEDEWERACKGPESRVYAYGDRYEAGLCPPSGDRPNYRVDAHPACVSGYGVFGLSGGVAEWTATRRGRGYVVKPGDVADDHRGTRCAGRSDRPPDFRQIHLGFRCCSDP